MKNNKSNLHFCCAQALAKAFWGILFCTFGAIGCSASGGAAVYNDSSTTIPPGAGGTTASPPVTTGGTSGVGGATSTATATSGSIPTGGAGGSGGDGTMTGGSGGAASPTGGAPGTGGRSSVTGGIASGSGGSSSTAGTTAPDAGRTGGTTTISNGSGGIAAATGGNGGTTSTGGAGGVTGSGGSSGTGGSSSDAPILSVCPNCKAIFDGTSLSGWIQVPAASWSIVAGAMHSLGPARGFIYTTNTYGDFRFIFTSRLVTDPANHLPCVLFWGDSPTKDALTAIQIQPPNGYMWDYRTTSPTANQSPDRYETRFSHPAMVDTQWSQCEMLANRAAGTMRFACCQLTGTAPCKAAEVVDFKDPTAGLVAPLALQVHNAGMIEEFKDLYVESPVADPTTLLTTK